MKLLLIYVYLNKLQKNRLALGFSTNLLGVFLKLT